MSKWYYELPYGPLTEEDYVKLAIALYIDDPLDVEQQRIARRRGIEQREYIRYEIGKLSAKKEISSIEEAEPEDV